MDYKALVDELQSLLAEAHQRWFFRKLLEVANELEKTDDVKLLKVIARYKKLMKEMGDPTDWRKEEFKEERTNDITELTIKLIDYLNDYFGFLKPLK